MVEKEAHKSDDIQLAQKLYGNLRIDLKSRTEMLLTKNTFDTVIYNHLDCKFCSIC